MEKIPQPTTTRQRTFHVNVCFEFDQAPPRTFRGCVLAAHVRTGARMALQKAEQALRPARWSSVVVVLTREPMEAS